MALLSLKENRPRPIESNRKMVKIGKTFQRSGRMFNEMDF